MPRLTCRESLARLSRRRCPTPRQPSPTTATSMRQSSPTSVQGQLPRPLQGSPAASASTRGNSSFPAPSTRIRWSPAATSLGWTGAARGRGRARDQFAALLPLDERVSAPKHPDTLRARATLPVGPGAGDAGRARDRSPRCCPVDERVLGAEHPETLAAPAATSPAGPGAAGDAAGARDQYAALLPIDQRVRPGPTGVTLGGCIRNGLPVLAEHPGLRNTFSNALRAVIGAPGGQKLIMSGIVRFPTLRGSRRIGFACCSGHLEDLGQDVPSRPGN